MGKVQPLPYVEEHEVDEAKALIDSQFIKMTEKPGIPGKPFNFRPAGYMIACRIYVRDDELIKGKREDGSDYTIWTAPVTQQQDALTSVAALVCGVGPQAYKGFNPDGTERYPEGPWCRIGDWIVIPRASSFLCEYRGVKMAILPDDKVIGVIEDPTDITPLYVGPKV